MAASAGLLSHAKHRHPAPGAEGALDPLTRSLATPGGLVFPREATHRAEVRPVAPSDVVVARALEEVVRRVSWGGDRRRGVARIELGGAQAGTAIVVTGEGRDISVRIETRPGVELGALPGRLAERLRARGLSLVSVEQV